MTDNVAQTASIPASIVMAICQVQTTLEAVKKSNRNHHGGYNYASTDDIYAALTRKMGEVGLVCLTMEEKETEIVRVENKEGKTMQWGKFLFSFVLATKDATWTDARNRRSLFIQVTGPQTFQAANSYAEKSYLKSLFKIPTGDMDLDSMPQADNEEDQAALNSIGKVKRKSSSGAKKDGETVGHFNRLLAEIGAAEGAADCGSIWSSNAGIIATLPRAWYEEVSQTYYYKMKDFGIEVDVEDQRALQAAE